MSKILKRVLIGIGILLVVLFAAFQFLRYNTKKASPEATVTFKNGANISITYSRPSKKGRDVFGGLEPYGQVWRTGANEATTFTTDKPLSIAGKMLPAGKYTLWTIPEKDKWTVIFNKKQYGWGVGFDRKASREADSDVLQTVLPIETLANTQEMFEISIVESPVLALVLAWDKTKVSVPMSIQ